MKISPARSEAFLKAPDAKVRLVLLYGPDQGLIGERAVALAHTVVDDLADPFLVTRFDASALRQEPAVLADTATTYSMTGGRRLLWVTIGGEDLSAAFEALLEGPEGDALTVVEAGDLPTRSAVRKLCEGHDLAAAIGCYADNEAALANLVQTVARQYQLTIERQAESFLLQYLGADRAASRAELEKLALYAGDGGTITLDDAMTVVGDGAALSLDEIVFGMTDGDVPLVDRQIARAYDDGITPVALLRAGMRHLQRLHLACTGVAGGQRPEQAMKSLRPLVIFFHVARFRRALEHWTPERTARALNLLSDAEMECKTTGLPDQAICSRALISIANAARRQAPRRRATINN